MAKIENIKDYEVNEKRTDKKDFTVYNIYKDGIQASHVKPEDMRETIETLTGEPTTEQTWKQYGGQLLVRRGFIVEPVVDEASFSAEKADYDKKEGDNIKKLRDDLEEENGFVGHPKAKRLWDKAWEFGHSAGLHEVVLYYRDLADLIK